MKCLRLACLCALFVCGCATPTKLSVPRDSIVIEWNNLHLAAIRAETPPAPLATRNLAIVHVAIYDAINSIYRTRAPYLVKEAAVDGCSAETAAVGAAHQCLVTLYPSCRALFDAPRDRFLTNSPPGNGRVDGLALGRRVADEILRWRSDDGASTSVPYIPRNKPGDWRRTPPFFRPPDLPQWPHSKPFSLTDLLQFAPPGPPALDSARYAGDVNQVKLLGGANNSRRTPEQTQIARFWSDFSYTVTPPGHWNQIAQNISANLGLSLAQNARLFALMNIAMADAGVVAWDAKFKFNLWRPVTAIRQADSDDNPDTVTDPDWSPLLNTPAFPEYVSGHSAFSGAASTVLATFLGNDHVPFTVGSDSLPGVTRSYHSLNEAAEEIGMSRIYGGIHYLFSDLDGLAAGRAIGDYVSRNLLRPLKTP